jgi:hypothetical protein
MNRLIVRMAHATIARRAKNRRIRYGRALSLAIISINTAWPVRVPLTCISSPCKRNKFQLSLITEVGAAGVKRASYVCVRRRALAP